jgi:hypothetical protein
VFKQLVSQPFDLTILWTHLYWTDVHSRDIHWTSKYGFRLKGGRAAKAMMISKAPCYYCTPILYPITSYSWTSGKQTRLAELPENIVLQENVLESRQIEFSWLRYIHNTGQLFKTNRFQEVWSVGTVQYLINKIYIYSAIDRKKRPL